MKNILILTGSPRKNGSSSLLADQFEKGAISSGNIPIRFDTAFLDINDCQGCDLCKSNNNNCYQKDDFVFIKDNLMIADAVVFVTPVYYFGISAQLKAVIDRFHSISNELKNKKRKTILMVTAASNQEDVAEAIILNYKKIIEYLNWEDMGIIAATGIPDRETIQQTNYPLEALELGKNIF